MAADRNNERRGEPANRNALFGAPKEGGKYRGSSHH
jgi:hypothetical protein